MAARGPRAAGDAITRREQVQQDAPRRPNLLDDLVGEREQAAGRGRVVLQAIVLTTGSNLVVPLLTMAEPLLAFGTQKA
jgi:hypothetical protein